MLKKRNPHCVKSHLLQGLLIGSLSVSLLACQNEPSPSETLVVETLSKVECPEPFKKTLFDNIFKNLARGLELPTSEELSPYIEHQLSLRPELSSPEKAHHLEAIKASYLEVIEALRLYEHEDLGLPGDFGAWLADIEMGRSNNEEQSQWLQEINRKFDQLHKATQILDQDCHSATPTNSARSGWTSQPVRSEAFYFSEETINQLDPLEAETLIQERSQHPYLARGYFQSPARIHTDIPMGPLPLGPENEESEMEASPLPEDSTKDSERDHLARQWEGPLPQTTSETSEPTPSNWSPLSAFNPPPQGPGSTTTENSGGPLPNPSGSGTFEERLFASYHPVFAGALKTMAVLYQSCSVLEMDLVNGSNAPNLNGLRHARTGRLGNQTFGIYEIADKTTFTDRHYYISRVDQSHDPSFQQCRNVRQDFPSMYVYSGQPGVTVIEKNQDEVATVNLFRQTSHTALELGMDCSAFVGTAFQAAGLKVSRASECRAFERLGATTALINYQSRDYNCLFEPQKDQGNTNSSIGPIDLDSGDVFTLGSYHTIIIGQVGYDGDIPDPFRLRRFTDISQCRIEAFTYDTFDFDIIHSSAARPQLGLNDSGIGVVRHHAQTYFANDTRMGEHLKKYAVQACKRKFDRSAPPYQHWNVNILRHRPIEECMCPEKTLLYMESCISGCDASVSQ